MDSYYLGTIVKISKPHACGYIKPLWGKTKDDNIFFHFSSGITGKSYYKINRPYLFRVENTAKNGRRYGRTINVIIPMAVDIAAAKQCDEKIVSEAMKITNRPKTIPNGTTLLKRRALIKKYNDHMESIKKDVIIDEEINRIDDVENICDEQGVRGNIYHNNTHKEEK
ncbi:MAG: hypothetical protein HUJ59_04410 [Bacilli bacterium]|nr:hypothetical protein [Bacilli bacterium]